MTHRRLTAETVREFQCHRRQVLQQSMTGLLGLNLPGLLWARSALGNTPDVPGTLPKLRSCIIVFYYGGPSHIDTYDMKPLAPQATRGEFQPIATSVPGLTICEHLPFMSKMMHKVAVVRSMHHANRLHDSASTEALTGRQSPVGDREEFAPIPQFYPCHGATLSYMRRDLGLETPHAALPYVFHNVVDTPCQGGGFLGGAYDPLQIDVNPEAKSYMIGSLASAAEQSALRVNQRRQLLTNFDQRAGLANQSLTAASSTLSRYYDKAYQLLDSTVLRQVLKLDQESAATRERYGFDAPLPGSPVNGGHNGFAREMRGQNLLLARRLVEAGVPFVNVYDYRQQGQNWDAHADNFGQHKNYLLPLADRSLSALIEDLEHRGLLDSTLVVAMGEFGRTPTINANAGRDHWPDCYSIVLAGGGIRGGTVFGSSDKIGAYPATEPVTPADLAATIFWRFGIDHTALIHDQTGRPHKLADGQPITQIFV